MADPLRLYWWRDTPNFGDAISKRLTSRPMSRVNEVEWSPPDKRQDQFFRESGILDADFVRVRDFRGAYDDHA